MVEKELADRFELFLLQGNRKASTVKKYISCIKLLIKTCGYPLEKNALDKHFLNLKRLGKRGRYLNFIVGVVRAYGDMLQDNELRNYRFFKKEEVLKETMSDSEIENFLALPASKYCNHSDYEKWTLYFSIIAFTSIRGLECASLRWMDIRLDEKVLRVTDSKSQVRLLKLNSRLEKIIKDYIEKHKINYSLSNTDYIFSGRNGAPHFTSSDWSYNFQQRCERLGIKRPGLTCHSLRHSGITRLIREGVPLFTVMKIAGHKKAETTLVYAHLDTTDVGMAVERDPMNRVYIDDNLLLELFKEKINEFVKTYGIDKRASLKYQFIDNLDDVTVSLTKLE